MLVNLTEVKEKTRPSKAGSSERTKTFTLQEVLVNPDHVVCLREDESMTRNLSEGLLPSGLDGRQKFTRIFLERGQSGIDLVVVGTPEQIRQKFHEKNVEIKRELLRG